MNENTKIRIIDEQSRNRIASDINTNFFVEAGAGSGKTTSLVERMITMVESGIDVGKICAITFTKAAAAEFYIRFQSALTQKVLSQNSEVKRQYLTNALRDIDLCFMGTIDAFCNMILSEHPVEAGIPSESSVKSNDEMINIYTNEYSRIACGEYGNHLKNLYYRFYSFHYNPKSVFINSIQTILNTRNAEFIYQKPSTKSVDELFKNEKAELLSVLNLISSHPEAISVPTSGNPDKFIKQFKKYLTKSEIMHNGWDNSISDIIFIMKDLNGLRINKDFEYISLIPDSIIKPHITAKGKLTYYTLDIYGEGSAFEKLAELQYSVTMDFLISAAEKITEHLRSQGQLSYFDYLLYLRNMLKKDAENKGKLIRHIYNRHSYFLIDEFQDTNPMQAEIFFYITAINPVSDWKKCIPYPGSLFIVGDPKQSIYRFRNADVASYLNVKQMFNGEVGDVLSLSRNFRSDNNLCLWFNKTFERLLPEDNEYQCAFPAIPLDDAAEDSSSFGGIFTYTDTPDGLSDPENVISIIKRLIHNPSHKIIDKKSKQLRLIEFKDFMVITPSKTRLKLFLQAFDENRIPARIDGKVNFNECPALIAVSDVIAAISSPNDSMKLYGALSNDLFGITNAEFIELKNSRLSFNLYANTEEISQINPKAYKAIKLLSDIAHSVQNLSVVAAFNCIAEKLCVFTKVGTKNLEYYYYALELLRSGEESGDICSLTEAASYLSELIKDKSDAERCISLQKTENRVHVANLHKVKGLEAPIVILAAPSSKPHSPELHMEINGESRTCHIFKFSSYLSVYAKTSLYKNEEAKEDACLEAEKIRLLYVAATRARSALIIGDARKANQDRSAGNPWAPLITDELNDIFLYINEKELNEVNNLVTVDSQKLFEEAKKDSVFNNSVPEEKSYSITRPSKGKVKPKTASEDDFEDIIDVEMRSKSVHCNAALIGSMVHKLMESLVSSGNKYNLATLTNEIVNDYSESNEDYKAILLKVGKQIQSGGYVQSDGKQFDILSELLSADEVYCEVPFCYKDTSDNAEYALWHGVMDVIFLKNGQWNIVDYKTNAEIDDLEIKYQEQLDSYKNAFLKITGNKANVFIYHIDV